MRCNDTRGLQRARRPAQAEISAAPTVVQTGRPHDRDDEKMTETNDERKYVADEERALAREVVRLTEEWHQLVLDQSTPDEVDAVRAEIRKSRQDVIAGARRYAKSHFRAARRPTRQRSTARAPRRAPVRTAPRVGGDGDGNAPPEPPAGPLVHQGSSGLPRRKYLALVRAKNIRHAKIGRLIVCRRDEFLAALGLADAPASPAPTAPAWSPEAMRLRLLSGGRK